MAEGIRTTNIPRQFAIDELLGNVTADGVEKTARIPIQSLTSQLAGSGPFILGNTIYALTKTALDAITPPNSNMGGVVLQGVAAGYYARVGSAWVKGRGFPDTFAKVAVSGTGTAQTGLVGDGVDPASIEVFFAKVATPNTGPLTLSISGGPARSVRNLAGNTLSVGEWTGMVMFYLNDANQYQLLIDAGAAASAAASASLAGTALLDLLNRYLGPFATDAAATAAAGTPTEGQLYFNTTAGVFRVYHSGAWQNQSTGLADGDVTLPKLSASVVAQLVTSVLAYIPVNLHASIKDHSIVTDITSYVQAALTANSYVFFPPGRYPISQITLSKPGTFMEGAGYGPGGAELYLLTAAQDHVLVPSGSAGCEIRGFSFTPAVAQTGGSFVRFNDGYARLDKFWMTGWHRGVLINSGEVRVTAGWLREGRASLGRGIEINATSGLRLSDLIMACNTAAQPESGIHVLACHDLEIEGCNIYGCGIDLNVRPAGGAGVASIKATGTFFDTAIRGLYLAPATAGFITRCRFVGCWFGSHTQQGVAIDASGGSVDDISFVGGDVLDNDLDGISITGALRSLIVQGLSFSQNTGAALSLSSSSARTVISGNYFGPTASLGANGYGVYVNTGADKYSITGNVFDANAGGNLFGHTASASKVVTGNVGA